MHTSRKRIWRFKSRIAEWKEASANALWIGVFLDFFLRLTTTLWGFLVFWDFPVAFQKCLNSFDTFGLVSFVSFLVAKFSSTAVLFNSCFCRVHVVEQVLGEYNNLKKLNDFLEGPEPFQFDTDAHGRRLVIPEPAIFIYPGCSWASPELVCHGEKKRFMGCRSVASER